MINGIWLRAAQEGNLIRIKGMKKELRFLDINCVSCLGQSALMLAIAGKHRNVIKYLIKLNCDLNICDAKGENALSLSLRTENYPLFEFLYKKGCRLCQKVDREIKDIESELIKKIDNWKLAKYVYYTHLKHKITLI